MKRNFFFARCARAQKSPYTCAFVPAFHKRIAGWAMPQSGRRCLPQVWAAEDSASANSWQFKAFGTSSAANVNTLADGADIHGKVALNACTVKEDGTIFPF